MLKVSNPDSTPNVDIRTDLGDLLNINSRQLTQNK